MSGRTRVSRWELLLCALLFVAVQTAALVHQAEPGHQTGPHACVICVVADHLGHCMPSAIITMAATSSRFEPPKTLPTTAISAAMPPFDARGPPAREDTA